MWFCTPFSMVSIDPLIQVHDEFAEHLVLCANQCHDLVDLVQLFYFALQPFDILLFSLPEGSLGGPVLLRSLDGWAFFWVAQCGYGNGGFKRHGLGNGWHRALRRLE